MRASFAKAVICAWLAGLLGEVYITLKSELNELASSSFVD